MNERERLIELLKGIEYQYTKINSIKTENVADWLLRNGVIVSPCKVGDALYSIDNCVNRPEKIFVIAIHQYEKHISISALSRSQREYVFEKEDIGKTVFLTKEEAEQALKEGVAE